MTELYLMALFFCVAGFVQGAIGFGSGMVAMSLLALVTDLQNAVALVAPLTLLICLWLLWQHRSSVSRERVQPLLVGAVVGVPIGVWALSEMPAAVLLTALGAVILSYVAQQLIVGHAPGPTLHSAWGYLAGLVGGGLGGAFNCGGPPAVLYVRTMHWSKTATIGTLQAYFAVANTFQIVLLIAAGLMTWESATQSLVLVPAVGVGVVLGTVVCARIDESTFRGVMLAGLAVLGVQFALRGIF